MTSTAETLLLFRDDGLWHRVSRRHPAAVELADRHYSRQTVGAADFMANGKTFVMLTADGLAVWGVIENMDIVGRLKWRCSIFRNEGPHLSSILIREATTRTYVYWERHYGGRPDAPLRTEVDGSKVRRKRDPGRCFLKAGWKRIDDTQNGLAQFEAPQ